jgi:hypothetical protein
MVAPYYRLPRLCRVCCCGSRHFSWPCAVCAFEYQTTSSVKRRSDETPRPHRTHKHVGIPTPALGGLHTVALAPDARCDLIPGVRPPLSCPSLSIRQFVGVMRAKRRVRALGLSYTSRKRHLGPLGHALSTEAAASAKLDSVLRGHPCTG